MLQKIPLSFAQSWGACSKLFQLTNLRRLQISQDPKTSSSPHRFLQAYLKGKLISQTHPKPGLCSQQEALCGVILSDLASGRQECVEGKYWTSVSANEPCKISTSINNQEIWLQSCHLPLVFETAQLAFCLSRVFVFACLSLLGMPCMFYANKVCLFVFCLDFFKVSTLFAGIVIPISFLFCFALTWVTEWSLPCFLSLFFVVAIPPSFLCVCTCYLPPNPLATSSFTCVVVCPSLSFALCVCVLACILVCVFCLFILLSFCFTPLLPLGCVILLI